MANNKIYSDYLMHYRTKGSRNGYSKDPNYTPVGQKAMTPFEMQERRVKGYAVRKGTEGMADQMVKGLDRSAEKREKEKEERDRRRREEDAKWRDEMNKKAMNTAETTADIGSALMGHPDKLIKRGLDERKKRKEAEAERDRLQDANIEYQRKRAQQAREDRANANRTRYKQQEAIEATKAGHGKAPTHFKSGRYELATAGGKGAQNSALSGYTQVKQAQRAKRDYYHNELEKSKKISDKRNSRSDIGNAIADAKSDAKKFGKKVRNVSDFVVEDTADRAKKLVNKGKKKVSKLLKKFR